MRRTNNRNGVTFIELLVILGLMLVLLALLLPAVMLAREASRRTQCRDNLKRLGVALHNYYDAYRLFPPGIVTEPNGF